MGKFSPGQIAEALRDVDENYGVMWRAASGYEAKLLWDELHRQGLVEFNPWAGRYLPTERRSTTKGHLK